MSVVLYVPLHDLRRRPDCRPLDQNIVQALAKSIRQLGLRSPINVRPIGNSDQYELIAGSHRVAACELLGETEILAVQADDDDLKAELATIDENLVRAELSQVDRARQTARRKELYEALHPETKHETFKGNQYAGSRQVGDNHTVPRFTADTATKTGQSERSVQRSAERGEKIAAEVLDLVRGTRLDIGAYLDQLKRLSPTDQVKKARSDLAGSRSAPAAASTASSSASDPPATFQRFVTLADQIEALPVAEVIAGSGRQRAVLGQRASGLAERMSEIMEGLSQ